MGKKEKEREKENRRETETVCSILHRMAMN